MFSELIKQVKPIVSFVLKVLSNKQFYTLIARYALAILMMGFGVMKLMGMQFHYIVPSSSWGQSLENLSGRQITWAFFGYSTVLQVFLGVFEFVPSCLLLFRRTALIGAIFLLPVSVGVLLVNYSLELWSNTQTLSLIILLLNSAIIILERKKIFIALRTILNIGVRHRYFAVELVVGIIIIIGLVYRKASGDYGKTEVNELTGNWFNQQQFEFTLMYEKVNDSLVPQKIVRSYFGPWGIYSEINEASNNVEDYINYKIDSSEKGVKSFTIDTEKTGSKKFFYYLNGNYVYSFKSDTLILKQRLNDTLLHQLYFKRRVVLKKGTSVGVYL